MCFSAFLYQYIEFFVFLKVGRRGGYSPPSPPKSTTDILCISALYYYITVLLKCPTKIIIILKAPYKITNHLKVPYKIRNRSLQSALQK